MKNKDGQIKAENLDFKLEGKYRIMIYSLKNMIFLCIFQKDWLAMYSYVLVG